MAGNSSQIQQNLSSSKLSKEAYLKEHFPIKSQQDVFREKDMFLGPRMYTFISEFYAVMQEDNIIISKQLIKCPYALFQTFREMVSNIADQSTRIKAENSKGVFDFKLDQITDVKIIFSKVNHSITTYNNGSGFLIEEHSKHKETGRIIYIPEFVCTGGWTGSNHADNNRLTGGVNGLGIKLVTSVSKEFKLSTIGHNFNNKKFFFDLKIENLGVNIIEPNVKPLNNEQTEKTVFSYIPDYKGHFAIPESDYDEFISKFEQHLFGITCLMAVWFGPYKIIADNKKIDSDMDSSRIIKSDTVVKDAANVYFNGQQIKLYNTSDLAKAVFPELKKKRTDDTIVFFNTDDFIIGIGIWEVTIVVHEPRETHNISLINGLIIQEGDHFKKINKMLLEFAKNKLLAEYQGVDGISAQINTLEKCMTIIVRATISTPSFTGQIKNYLALPTHIKSIPLSDKFMSKVTDNLTIIFKRFILVQAIKTAASKKKRVERPTYEKYTAAQYAGTNVTSSLLFLVEGDSALGGIKRGISCLSKKDNKGRSIIGPEFCGTFSLGGVTPNVYKSVKVELIKDEKGNTIRYYSIPDKIKENKVLSQLMLVLGLDINKKYELAEERNELKYTKVIIAVDWDLDGVGNILGLVLTWFHRFWPELLKSNYVMVFRSPIIRAKPLQKYRKTHKLHEFMSEVEYREWRDTNDESHYEIIYYKGLARHEQEMIERMFNNISGYLITYGPDEDFDKYMNIFYGSDADERKRELTIPYEPYTLQDIINIDSTKKWCSTIHLKKDSKAFQLDNLRRKLPNAIDGFIDVRRKIFAAMFNKYGSLPDKAGEGTKIFQAAGMVAEKMMYHHGDMSINNAIVNMGQTYLGGRKLPLLRGLGEYGTRNGTINGIGCDSGQPRYLNVKLNTTLAKHIFRLEDNDILAYRYGDDGTRIEPEFFVPIIPIVILETESIPAHGWNQTRHARDFFEVCNRVKSLITNYDRYKFSIDLIDNMTNYGIEKIIEDSDLIDNLPNGEVVIKEFPKISSMKMNLDGFDCYVRYITDDKEITKKYIIGKYSMNINRTNDKSVTVINITELPPGVGAEQFRFKLHAKLVYLLNSDEFLTVTTGKTKSSRASINDPIKSRKVKEEIEKKYDDRVEVFNKGSSETINILVNINTKALDQLLSTRIATRDDEVKCKTMTLEEIVKELNNKNINRNNIKYIDPIEDLLGLYDIIHDNLNFLKIERNDLVNIINHGTTTLFTETEEVEETEEEIEKKDIKISKIPNIARCIVGSFKTYEEILLYWFIVRKEFYEHRIKREIKIKELNVLYHSEILRFINSSNTKFADKVTRQVRVNQLDTDNYAKFLDKSIGSCEYLRAEKIDAHIFENLNTRNNKGYKPYKYIFDITEEDKTDESIERRTNTIEKLNKEINILKSDVKPFIGANTWLKELDELIEAYNKGKLNNWKYCDDFSGIKYAK